MFVVAFQISTNGILSGGSVATSTADIVIGKW